MAGHKSTFAYVGNWDKRNQTQPRSGFGICRYDTERGELKLITDYIMAIPK